MKEHIFIIIGLIALTDVCDTVGQLILKSSINKINWHINTLKKAIFLIIELLKMPRIWFGFILSGVSLIFWLIALTKADLNLAFSLDSMRYIMIAIASMLFLKEKISNERWFGIIFVVFGIVLAALG